MKTSFRANPQLFGYRYTPDKRYEIVEHEAIAVRMLFNMYIQGYGYLQIAHELNSRGYRTRLGTPFGKNYLHDLLTNRRYIGTAILGKNFMPASGKRNNHRPEHDKMLIAEEENPPGHPCLPKQVCIGRPAGAAGYWPDTGAISGSGHAG